MEDVYQEKSLCRTYTLIDDEKNSPEGYDNEMIMKRIFQRNL